MSEMAQPSQISIEAVPSLDTIALAMDRMAGSFCTARGEAHSLALELQHSAQSAAAAVSDCMASLARAKAAPWQVNAASAASDASAAKAAGQPAWNSVSGPAQTVFINSGKKRFQSELEAAEAAALRLCEAQKAVSREAGKMSAAPPGMLEDVEAVNNRVQALSTRIQALNQIPVKFRTDTVNQELEKLRGQLGEAAVSQQKLTAAMSNMDVGAVNTAYQNLNKSLGTAEKSIRDNLAVKVKDSAGVAGMANSVFTSLGKSLMGSAKGLFQADTVKKVLSIADQQQQSQARLGQANYGGDTAEGLQQKVFEASQRSGGGLQATADTVAALGTQARGQFSSNDELIAFTELLNQSLAIAGTDSAGAGAATQQITKAMASGGLQGSDMESLIANAQPIAQNLAQYLNVPQSELKELASQGAVTADVLKNAMFAAAEETNAKFQQVPMTFSQAASGLRDQALMALGPVLQKISALTRTEEFGALVSNAAGAVNVLASAAAAAVDMMGQAAALVRENWSWLLPIILGIAGAMLVYNGAILANNIVMGISNGIKLAAAAATTVMTIAQSALNGALLACPITWIIIAVIALIAAVYAGVAVFNKLAGTSLSVTGLVAGAFGVLAAHVNNGFVVPLWNSIAAFINFFYNVWSDPIASVKILFFDLVSTLAGYFLTIGRVIEGILNKIPGVEIDITSGIDNLVNQLETASKLAKDESEWKEIVTSRAYVDYSDAASRAYAWGDQWGAKKESQEEAYKTELPLSNAAQTQNMMSDLLANTGNTAKNTAAMTDTMDLMDEELKYMRDAAEQEIINRFTLAELKVDVSNNNTLATKMDFDDVNRQLAAVTGEILATSAEGGYI